MDTLLAGFVNAFSIENIKTIFADDAVVAADGSLMPQKIKKIRYVDISPLDDGFKHMFTTYGFERIVYISDQLNRNSSVKDENSKIASVLSLAREVKIRQFIYLAPILSKEQGDSDAGILQKNILNLIEYYQNSFDINVKVIYCPSIIGNICGDDIFSKTFEKLSDAKEISLEASDDTNLMMVSSKDVSVFLQRLFEDFKDEREDFVLWPKQNENYGGLRRKLMKLFPYAKIKSDTNYVLTYEEENTESAIKRYGWNDDTSISDEVENMYLQYKKNLFKKLSILEKIRSKIKLSKIFLMIVELVVGCVIVEFLISLSGESVQFRMIDYRLLFVVIMASCWGTTCGFIAASLMVISLIYAYYGNGINALMLFYDAGNWIAFILFYIVAAICSYARQSSIDETTFVKEENEKLIKENAFVNNLYDEAMQYKNEYKQNLTMSKEGFGRIFDVVKRLNHAHSERIFAESIPVMEDVLDNKSIAIYTVYDSRARFARLEVASAGISGMIDKSLDLSMHKDIMDTVNSGELWINTNPKQGEPSYVAGVMSDGHVTVLIMVMNVAFSQMSTYYANLIRILAGLLESFIVKAWQYQSAVRRREFHGETNIMQYEYFKKHLLVQKEMTENEITSFRLIKINGKGKSVEEWDEILRGKTRYNDAIGYGEDGNVYILVSQVDEKSEMIVLNRFKDMGLECEIIRDI